MSNSLQKNRLIIFGTIALCAVLGFAGTQRPTAPQQGTVAGPIIQNVTTDSVTITWVTQNSPGELKKENGETFPITQPVFQRTEITGLEPGTRYTYDLSKSGTAIKGSFVTAPKNEVPFTFIAYGDTRTRDEVHRRVVGRIVAEKPSFVLHTGDLVGNGLRSEEWDKFFDITHDLLSQIPFYPVLGNHENNSPVYFKFFTAPGGNAYYYSFDWSSAHIVALDTIEVGKDPQAKEAFFETQLAWLKEDLRKNHRPLVFVFQHHPLHTAIESRRESAAKLAALLEPIFVEGGVMAVFSGHDHNYQHHVLNGLHHIVTGGGGAPLYDLSPIPEVTVKAVKTENYVRVHVDGRKAHIEAVDLDGNLIESFDLIARDGVQQRETKTAGNPGN